MKHYIGLDAHLTTCTFVILNGLGKETGKIKVPTTEKNLVKYIRTLKGEKHLTFEESNLAKWLYVTLRSEVDELVVCNPTYIAKKQGAKNDYNDALHLANELRCNHLVPVFHDEDNEYIELRALVSGYNDLISTTTRTKNQYNAIFRSQAIKTFKKSEYKDEERIDLLDSDSKKFVCEGLFKQIQSLQETRKSYEVQFAQNIKKYKLLKNLNSIPGISDIRSHIIGSIVCDGKRFPNKHHFWSYAMLVKHHDTSDGVLYGKRNAWGRTELKNVFMGAAECILMHGNNSLRRYYDQLKSKGVQHREAKKSVARRIASIALMIMKTGNQYEDNFQEKKIEKTNLK